MASVIILTLALFYVSLANGSYLTNRVFKWTHNVPTDYTSKGRELKDNWFFSSTKRDVRLCAYSCLKSSHCQSYNYYKSNGRCYLNRKDHNEVSLQSVSSDIFYHHRDEYVIDQDALGPCAGEPCNGHGRCIETKTSDDELIGICLCSKGWGGSQCDMADAVPEWGTWQGWDDCSVTCGQGYRLRTRNCEDGSNGQTLSSMECYGRDIEYDACQMPECPRWDIWGEWGNCTTYQTCGRGYKVRHRTCTNGGTPGVDRYCLGSTNETTVCYGLNCKGLMRLKGGAAYGEGRVEFYNDVSKEWGLVCGDQWTLQAADLVCKQLGMPGAHLATQDNRFGVGEGLYGVSSLACTGAERTVQMCERNPWSLSTTCGTPTQPAGVICKVNGVWSLWEEWGGCSVTCENGIRQRTRSCNHPPALHGGRDCVGDTMQTKSCTLDMCPVDGQWRTWGEWSTCSTSCGKGTQWRERTCNGPFHNGLDCTGESRQTQECQIKECPVDGVWNGWETWGDCTVICGGGTRLRTRTCQGPFFEGAPCPGNDSHTEPCNLFECPVDGAWLPWHDWRDCNVTCGGGHQIRKRDCSKPKHGGNNCEGPSQEMRDCSTQNCPVDGEQVVMVEVNGTWIELVDGIWAEWAKWSTCTHTCGGGKQWRTRNCIGPFDGGIDCEGPRNTTQACNTQNCPIDGVYEPWSEWGSCSLTCGGGTRDRTRVCIQPQYGGRECPGPPVDTTACNTQHCPVDGSWREWGEWGPCNTTCGGGFMKRVRVCDEPQYGGADCVGAGDDERTCSPNPCPIPGDWFDWSDWSPCSVTCGGGQKSRSRVCDMTSYGDLTAPCEGPEDEVVDCHTFACTPLARTCSEWGNRGLTADTMADIDPDEEEGPLEETRVWCDMTSNEGVGVTVIGHEDEEEVEVVGYEGAGEYELKIQYNITLAHTIAVIDASESCRQFVRWRCKAALIHNPYGEDEDGSKITTGWKNRTGGIADYFGDAPPGSGKCSCGVTQTCAEDAEKELMCNCDKNDNEWREDSGYLSYKDDLPVTEFIAGDTGDVGQEEGSFTVGPVECFGMTDHAADA